MIEHDAKRAEQLVMEMMAIDGPSGEEGPIMDYLVDKLRQAGVAPRSLMFDQAHRRSPLGGQIGNLALRLPGTMRGPRRMLMAHVDTVPLCRGSRPVKRGRWVEPAEKHTALGADDRSGTAVVLSTALAVLASRQPHPPLTFLWTVQEEVGLQGARHLRLGMLGKPQMAFNFDGGPPEKLTIGATGGYRMNVAVEGIASHAGNAPADGISAITIASLAIARLHEDGWLGDVVKKGRCGTSNVGAFHGGEATNVVTPRVDLAIEARSHDPAFRRQIVRAIEQAFRRAAKEVRNRQGTCGRVTIEGRLDYESYRLADDEPCLAVAEDAVRSVGGDPQPAITNGGLDANWLNARGIPTVSLGCGQRGGHTVAERLNLDEFHQACRIALVLAGEG